MLKHWKEDARLAIRVMVIVTVLVYGPILFYQGLVKTVYEDHQQLAAGNAKLLNERESLNRQLDDSNRNSEQRCEQAKGKEIAGLRKRVGQACYLPDRKLSDEGRDSVFHTLKKIKAANARLAAITICAEYPGDFDTINFTSELDKLFRNADWTVLPCDPELVKAIAKYSVWRGLVMIDKQRQTYKTVELQNAFLQAGVDISPFFQENLIPDKFDGTMLLVGFKYGYRP